jgi:O-antigen/teichoic acid export membrane protein
MVLAEAFIDGGFGSALIQKKNPTQTDYSTIFFWNMFMAIMMYFVLYVTAPVIARFYNIPLLCSVLRVQGLVLFIYAFNIVQRNQLRKKLNFKILSKVTIVTSVTSLTITIFLAYHGFGVWSLVANNLVSAAIPAFVFWFYIKWRPMWSFSWQSFRELFGFGFYMFLTHLITSFSLQIQGLLIGKTFNSSTMGYYSKALGTEKLASQSIASIMSQVTYPLYAEVQDDKKAMINMIKRFTTIISYITFPLMAILIIIAKPIFILLYSDRWVNSVPYFQVLCLAGVASCLISVNLQTISAIGKSRTMFVWTIIKFIFRLVFVIGGLVLFGMKGLLAGVVLTTWFAFFVNIGLVSKYIGYKWARQLLDLMPVAMVAFVAAIISFSMGRLLDLSLYFDGIVKVVVYVIIYLGWSIIFKPEAYTYFLSVIPQKYSFFGKRIKV